MRLKRNRLNEYQHRKAIPKRDSEGNSYTEYSPPDPIQAEMWAGGGKLQSEIYGTRLPNIRNLRIQERYHEIPGINGKVSYQLENGIEIAVGDGICLYVSGGQDPDYKVVAVYPYSHLTLEVEKT